jgi:1-acyl-sn-glycerol-3-phosphate acyltransferase
MKFFRVAIRLAAFAMVSAMFTLLLLAGGGVLALFGRSKLRWRRFNQMSWGRWAARAIGMRVHVSGEPPRPPYFLVANHLSYVDIIAFSACLDCVFVSRGDVGNWPGIGWMARTGGTIFLNRENIHDIPRVIGTINRTLDAEMGVLLFPEGTSTKGDSVWPFKPSLLEPAARAGYPVSYAAITYRTPPAEPPAHLAVCWWGEMTLTPHLLELLRLRRFDCFITFGDHAIQADDRKVLAKSLWRAVNDIFDPVVQNNESNQEKER